MTNLLIPHLKGNTNNYIERELEFQNSKNEPFEKTITVNIPLLNINVDKISLIIFSLSIMFLIIFWNSLGLFKMIPSNKILLLLFITQIIFFISQIFVSSTEYDSISIGNEYDRLTDVTHIGTVLFGSMILFVVFVFNFTPKVSLIIMTSIILNCLLFVYISIKNTKVQIRIIRKLKQSILNLSIFLFIVVVYLSLSGTSTKLK
jgi:hypothetical protein